VIGGSNRNSLKIKLHMHICVCVLAFALSDHLDRRFGMSLTKNKTLFCKQMQLIKKHWRGKYRDWGRFITNRAWRRWKMLIMIMPTLVTTKSSFSMFDPLPQTAIFTRSSQETKEKINWIFFLSFFAEYVTCDPSKCWLITFGSHWPWKGFCWE